MQTYTNPQFPGKVFRRLEVGEVIQEGDKTNCKQNLIYEGWVSAFASIGTKVEGDDGSYFYREITAETPLTTDQKIDTILAKLDAVLAKLNTNDSAQ